MCWAHKIVHSTLAYISRFVLNKLTGVQWRFRLFFYSFWSHTIPAAGECRQCVIHTYCILYIPHAHNMKFYFCNGSRVHKLLMPYERQNVLYWNSKHSWDVQSRAVCCVCVRTNKYATTIATFEALPSTTIATTITTINCLHYVLLGSPKHTTSRRYRISLGWEAKRRNRKWKNKRKRREQLYTAKTYTEQTHTHQRCFLPSFGFRAFSICIFKHFTVIN